MRRRIRDVGIVMPVYKQKNRYLREAIRSILHQSFRHFRLVIVLDGAPLRTANLVRRLVAADKRVKVIRYTHNRGVSSALNRGFQSLCHHKSIRYLTWVSSDNVYRHDFVRELRRKLRRSPAKVGLAYSSFYHINPNGKLTFGSDFIKTFRAYQQQNCAGLLDSCFIGPSFMYKRRYAERIDGYYLEPVEDYDYWLRLTDHCDIAYVPKELMKYRVSTEYSISRQLASGDYQHRRWRYAFQLTKQQARQRRGIEPEITVLVPVTRMNETVITQLEALYEQYYSNYKVIILDGTSGRGVGRALQDIGDPRVIIQEGLGTSESEMAQSAMGRVMTPFVMVYPVQEAQGCPDLQCLASHLRACTSEQVAATWIPNAGVYTQTDVPDGLQPGVLYRTHAVWV